VEPVRLHQLRRRVLRNDDPAVSVTDPRDDEPTSIHFAGLLGERLVVSASFFASVAPVDPELAAYQLRYMATDFDVQGRGFGALVLKVAEGQLRALGAEQLWANARDTALAFYRATGWSVVEGSEHLSAETRLPHTVIHKRLTHVR
jgi:GNAT superfamily N-acetyltransferase